jgi:hypothetical protein
MCEAATAEFTSGKSVMRKSATAEPTMENEAVAEAAPVPRARPSETASAMAEAAMRPTVTPLTTASPGDPSTAPVSSAVPVAMPPTVVTSAITGPLGPASPTSTTMMRPRKPAGMVPMSKFGKPARSTSLMGKTVMLKATATETLPLAAFTPRVSRTIVIVALLPFALVCREFFVPASPIAVAFRPFAFILGKLDAAAGFMTSASGPGSWTIFAPSALRARVAVLAIGEFIAPAAIAIRACGSIFVVGLFISCTTRAHLMSLARIGAALIIVTLIRQFIGSGFVR